MLASRRVTANGSGANNKRKSRQDWEQLDENRVATTKSDLKKSRYNPDCPEEFLNISTNSVDDINKYSWTLWKCWAKRLDKAFQSHIESNYLQYSRRGLAKKFYNVIHGDKLHISLHEEGFQIFQITAVGHLGEFGNGDVRLNTKATEVKCANNMETDQPIPEWRLYSYRELAQVLFDTLHVGDYLAVWGGTPNKLTKTTLLNNIDRVFVPATVMALYRHGSFKSSDTFDEIQESGTDQFINIKLSEPEYIVVQVFPKKQILPTEVSEEGDGQLSSDTDEPTNEVVDLEKKDEEEQNAQSTSSALKNKLRSKTSTVKSPSSHVEAKSPRNKMSKQNGEISPTKQNQNGILEHSDNSEAEASGSPSKSIKHQKVGSAKKNLQTKQQVEESQLSQDSIVIQLDTQVFPLVNGEEDTRAETGSPVRSNKVTSDSDSSSKHRKSPTKSKKLDTSSDEDNDTHVSDSDEESLESMRQRKRGEVKKALPSKSQIHYGSDSDSSVSTIYSNASDLSNKGKTSASKKTRSRQASGSATKRNTRSSATKQATNTGGEKRTLRKRTNNTKTNKIDSSGEDSDICIVPNSDDDDDDSDSEVLAEKKARVAAQRNVVRRLFSDDEETPSSSQKTINPTHCRDCSVSIKILSDKEISELTSVPDKPTSKPKSKQGSKKK